MSRERVLVAMSGGIDSTMVAIMLHQQGYEVIGITMKTWDYATTNTTHKETGCCNLESFNDARKAAVDNGFAHYVLDLREEFGSFVVDNFIDEYLQGRTPNPCVMCNTHIKWKALLKKADALQCQYIATGHYANLKQYDHNRYGIAKAADHTKDQSYVLWGLPQALLARTILPLGNILKTTLRQTAIDWGYTDLAKKSESYEICFVPNNDYRDFLKSNVKNLEQTLQGGNYIAQSGEVLGQHKGYPFYTIGQRKGLDIALGQPTYVTHIDPKSNTITLGSQKDLERTSMIVSKLNFMKYASLNRPMELTAKIRYRDAGTPSTVHFDASNLRAEIHFHKPVQGISPGQSAVFYEGDDVVAGGIILA